MHHFSQRRLLQRISAVMSLVLAYVLTGWCCQELPFVEAHACCKPVSHQGTNKPEAPAKPDHKSFCPRTQPEVAVLSAASVATDSSITSGADSPSPDAAVDAVNLPYLQFDQGRHAVLAYQAQYVPNVQHRRTEVWCVLLT